MNLKLRLESLCDAKDWARLHFVDGTTLTGRVLRVGSDYLEMESYGELERPGTRQYAKHLIPLSLLKLITIDSAIFAEAERHRLSYLSELETSPESLPELE